VVELERALRKLSGGQFLARGHAITPSSGREV